MQTHRIDPQAGYQVFPYNIGCEADRLKEIREVRPGRGRLPSSSRSVMPSQHWSGSAGAAIH
jgi:hypothetical protein